MICVPAPVKGRVNEDACYFVTNTDESLAVVIDGASQRIKLPQLDTLIDAAGLPANATAAAFVATQTRNFIAGNTHLPPEELIIGANDHLRARLETVINPLSAAAIAALLPEYADMLWDDPRLLRLMLPACVVTVARINHAENTLDFAHIGDTALIAFYESGEVEQVTADQMDRHDRDALKLALNVQAEAGAAHLSDVLDHPRVATKNEGNGIYHNYVDDNGATDQRLGVGVIDGLPEISAYIQTGQLSLDGVESLLLCSDGFPLPAPLDESDTQRTQRLKDMHRHISQHGLRDYVDHLRQVEADDWHRDAFPRFKVHDDATGLLLRLT